VLKNSVLRRIFGLERQKVTGGKKKKNYVMTNLYISSNIMRVIKSRGVK
jgi:hypothetical protein